jgi:hypothetical protein
MRRRMQPTPYPWIGFTRSDCVETPCELDTAKKMAQMGVKTKCYSEFRVNTQQLIAIQVRALMR